MNLLRNSLRRVWQSLPSSLTIAAEPGYLPFHQRVNVRAAPVCESVLCQFVSLLAKEKLKHRTIKAYLYLSAVRWLQIEEGAGDPSKPSLHLLEYVLKGTKRCRS